MKEILNFKNLLILSIIILLSSCGKTVDYDDEKEYLTFSYPYSDSPRVLSYKGLPFNGELVEYFDDEKTQLEERRDYKDGKIDGQYEVYNKNGQLKKNVTYNEGEVEEEVTYTYHENGQLEYKRTYKEGELDGPLESYYENGQLSGKGTYKNGDRVGTREDYYENGQLESKGTYKDGEEDGQWEYYDENGQLESKGTYKDGKEDGQWEYYDENGKLEEKTTYKDGVKQEN